MSRTDPQKWHEIKEIFYAALDLAEDERVCFLDTACKADADLRREIEEMLASSEAAGGFLETPAVEMPAMFQITGKSLATGREIGRYKVLRPLGSGGMGEVYLAEDIHLGRNVALKILSPIIDLDHDGLRRFDREAKVVSTLNHPNILTIYESGEEGPIKYIASEYVEGETLADRLLNGRPKVETALDIAIQITGALNAAHSAGIVHRDIKPDNIMIRPDGVVKLLDFGIAKLSEPIKMSDLGTAPGMIIGTPKYLSPEQAIGKDIDSRSDIFSFGLVLYEMLTGVKAFAADSSIEVISTILHKDPAPVNELVPDLSPDISGIVSKCLKKPPDERYSTTGELLGELENARQEIAIQNRLNSNPMGRKALQMAASSGAGAVEMDMNSRPSTTGTTFGEYIACNRRAAMIIAAAVLVIATSMILYFYLTTMPANTQIDSIAVLPFVNESGNPDADYLADGIAETLISNLSRLPALSVRSRSSAFAYKGKSVVGIKQIADELNVKAILNGTVAQRGDDLMIYVELVDIAADKVIWSQTYKQPMSSLLSLQAVIARDVAGNLGSKSLSIDEQALTTKYTGNAEAYRLYLKGNFEWNKHTQDSLRSAIDHYEQALKIDPNYALAYTGLSKTFGVLGNNYLPANETMPKAREYVEKALDIDNSLAEAHAIMAAVHLYYEWDRAAAETEVERAKAIDPRNVFAHQIAASRWESLGQFDEALKERQLALDNDPLSPFENWMLGETYYLKGDFDRAIAQLKQTLDLEPHFSPGYLYLGQAYEQKKMFNEAIETYQNGISQAEPNAKLIASLVHAYYLAGKIDQGNAAFRKLQEESEQHYVNSYIFAIAYAGMGDKEKMFASLEKATIERPADMLWLRVEPMFSPFHDDPRFQDLLKRMGV